MPSAFPSWILVTCFVLNSWIWVSLEQGAGYEKPSIQVVPSNVTIKGGDFTIRCRGPLAGVLFLLYRDSQVNETLRPPGNEAEFHVTNAQQRRDAGAYTCRYNPTSDLGVYSDASDRIDIQVRDTFPKPSLQASSGTVAVRGSALTFTCTGEHPNMKFTLRMGRTELQREEPSGNEAVFTIRDVERKDGGSYDCIYQTKSAQTVYSDPSVPILIRVRDLPKASISLEPVQGVKGDYQIRCSAPEDQNVRRFFFYQDGVEAALTDRSTPRWTHHVTFPVSHQNGKTRPRYRCSYQITESGEYLLSPLSDLVTLDNDKTMIPGPTKASSDGHNDGGDDDDDNTTNPPEQSPTFDNGPIIISVVCAALLLIGLIVTAVLYTRCRQKKTKGDIQTKGLCSIEERAAPAPETTYATVQKRKTPYAANVPEVRESDESEDQEGLTYVTINQEALKKKRPAQPRSEQDNTVYAAVNLH